VDRGIDSDVRETDPRTQGRERDQKPIDRTPEDNARLREQIDTVMGDRPTFPEFVARLEKSGIHVIPSLQKSGRLNGITYEVNGTCIRGSDLGRAYTARGLEKRHGVVYDPERDFAFAKELLERAKARLGPEERTLSDRRERLERRRGPDGLTAAQRGAMREIGKFRTVLANDFIRIHYGGNPKAWDRDIRPLLRQGLLEQRSAVITTHAKGERPATHSVSVVVLTKQGRNLMKRTDKESRASGQALYAGFVKPREIAHDAAIYRMYQAEAAHIQEQGGRIKRVVLDFELKKKAYAPLAKARAISLEEFHRKQRDVAEELGLKVVDGKMRLPDLRIEYETASGDATRVDLELATEHYRGEHMAAKQGAGFKIYAERASFPPGGSFGGSPVWDDHEIEVYSF
jgi:hypothetical protein